MKWFAKNQQYYVTLLKLELKTYENELPDTKYLCSELQISEKNNKRSHLTQKKLKKKLEFKTINKKYICFYSCAKCFTYTILVVAI